MNEDDADVLRDSVNSYILLYYVRMLSTGIIIPFFKVIRRYSKFF